VAVRNKISNTEMYKNEKNADAKEGTADVFLT
jgi:hypothetical protein